jgi:hypothetical protein
MKKIGVFLSVMVMVLMISGCGRPGPILSTPKNQAGTRAVILPGFTPAASAAAPPASAALTAPASAALAAAASPGDAVTDRETRAETAAALEAQSPGAPAPGAPSEAAAPATETGITPKGAVPEKIDIEIREKLFIAQTNDVYLNPEDYMGKTIKLEGLFKTQQYIGEDQGYHFVLRYGPGCCGNDGSAGFEVAWNSPETADGPQKTYLGRDPAYPPEDAWVEAVGILDSYEEDGYPYIFLNLLALTEKETRGAEFVTQ